MKVKTMKLSEIVRHLNPKNVLNFDEKVIKDIAYDSRRCADGSLFFAIRGFKLDGHKFAHDAVNRGAVGLVVEYPIEGLDVPQIVVQNTRWALSAVSDKFFGEPSKKLTVIGVTGTNGKTTTTFILRNIFNTYGLKCGLLGTIEYDLISSKSVATHTTPESRDIHEKLAEIVENGGRAAVLEVSSHALDEYRVAHVDFDVGVFTNLTRDHLDFHGPFENYRRAKARLFEMAHKAAINADDPNHEFFVSVFHSSNPDGELMTYGLERGDIRAEVVDVSLHGTKLKLLGKMEGTVNLKLIGIFNVYNALAAASAALLAGIPESEIIEGLESVEHVPGRFEVIRASDFFVVIDYAHTPDALEKLLKAVRSLNPNRVIVVFGAGGERDRGKRPMMASVVEKLADFAVVTSDNPRSEPPERIVKDILKGFSSMKPLVEIDRGKAIEAAMGMAKEGDVVVVAGKGHEQYQIIGTEYIPFSDREAVLKNLPGASPYRTGGIRSS